MKKLLLTGAALLAMATAASAQCHIGAQAGGSIANTTLGLGPASVSGLGEQSTRPDMGLHTGCDMRLSGTAWVVGLFAEYNWADVKFSVNPGLFSGSLGNSYSLGGRVGYHVGGALPYVLLAYTHTDANWSVASPLLPGSFKGITAGGGVEFPIPNTQLSLAAEARYTRFDSETIASTVSLQPDQLQAMVRLNFNFGAPAPAAAPLK